MNFNIEEGGKGTNGRENNKMHRANALELVGAAIANNLRVANMNMANYPEGYGARRGHHYELSLRLRYPARRRRFHESVNGSAATHGLAMATRCTTLPGGRVAADSGRTQPMDGYQRNGRDRAEARRTRTRGEERKRTSRADGAGKIDKKDGRIMGAKDWT